MFVRNIAATAFSKTRNILHRTQFSRSQNEVETKTTVIWMMRPNLFAHRLIDMKIKQDSLCKEFTAKNLVPILADKAADISRAQK
jgi:hypothetical protein